MPPKYDVTNTSSTTNSGVSNLAGLYRDSQVGLGSEGDKGDLLAQAKKNQEAFERWKAQAENPGYQVGVVLRKLFDGLYNGISKVYNALPSVGLPGADAAITIPSQTPADLYSSLEKLNPDDVKDAIKNFRLQYYIYDHYGYDLFELAISSNNLALVKSFIDAGIEPNSRTFKNSLLSAIENGNLEIVKILTETGADITLQPSIIACISSKADDRTSHDMALYLFERGADIMALDLYYNNVVNHLSECSKKPQLKRLLLKKLQQLAIQETPVDLTAMTAKDFYSLFQGLNLEQSKNLVRSYGQNINYRQINGYSLLALAITKKDWITAQAFIESGVDVNARTANGQTPLLAAIYAGNITMVKTLVAAGSHITNENLEQLLSTCIISPVDDRTSYYMALYLLQHGGHLEKRNAITLNLLDIYQNYENKPELQELLLSEPAIDVTFIVKDNLFSALENLSLEQAKNVIKNRGIGAFNNYYQSGYSLLALAIMNGRTAMAHALIEMGADLNLAGDNSVTPLVAAIHRGNTEILKTLVDAKADLNKTAVITPLEACIHSNTSDDASYDMARYLIEHGADVNQKNSRGLSIVDIFTQSPKKPKLQEFIVKQPLLDLTSVNEYGIANRDTLIALELQKYNLANFYKNKFAIENLVKSVTTLESREDAEAVLNVAIAKIVLSQYYDFPQAGLYGNVLYSALNTFRTTPKFAQMQEFIQQDPHGKMITQAMESIKQGSFTNPSTGEKFIIKKSNHIGHASFFIIRVSPDNKPLGLHYIDGNPIIFPDISIPGYTFGGSEFALKKDITLDEIQTVLDRSYTYENLKDIIAEVANPDKASPCVFTRAQIKGNCTKKSYNLLMRFIIENLFEKTADFEPENTNHDLLSDTKKPNGSAYQAVQEFISILVNEAKNVIASNQGSKDPGVQLYYEMGLRDAEKRTSTTSPRHASAQRANGHDRGMDL